MPFTTTTTDAKPVDTKIFGTFGDGKPAGTVILESLLLHADPASARLDAGRGMLPLGMQTPTRLYTALPVSVYPHGTPPDE